MENGWHQNLLDWFSREPRSGVYFIAFSAYRPDLVRDAAIRLALAHVDFREKRMAPLKWDAARLTLIDLDDFIMNVAQAGTGAVVQNVEALLSLKPSPERQAWLADVVGRAYPVPIVIPLMLYTHELPDTAELRTFVLEAKDLPPESLLERLLGTTA